MDYGLDDNCFQLPHLSHLRVWFAEMGMLIGPGTPLLLLFLFEALSSLFFYFACAFKAHICQNKVHW